VRRPEFIVRQTACPSGLLGRVVARWTARATREANRMAVQLLEPKAGDHVLEIGYGTGAAIARLSALVVDGVVGGVDRSLEMHRMASRRNAAAIAKGRVRLLVASAEALPYARERFDKALAVHTMYFWADPLRPFTELRRVLKPGGRLVLAYRNDREMRARFPRPTYRYYSERQIVRLLRSAPFEEVRVVRRRLGEGTVLFVIAVRARGPASDSAERPPLRMVRS
jgi:ubiquinone/menaquinone biosynthesis C-methylase UbiE